MLLTEFVLTIFRSLPHSYRICLNSRGTQLGGQEFAELTGLNGLPDIVFIVRRNETLQEPEETSRLPSCSGSRDGHAAARSPRGSSYSTSVKLGACGMWGPHTGTLPGLFP